MVTTIETKQGIVQSEPEGVAKSWLTRTGPDRLTASQTRFIFAWWRVELIDPTRLMPSWMWFVQLDVRRVGLVDPTRLMSTLTWFIQLAIGGVRLVDPTRLMASWTWFVQFAIGRARPVCPTWDGSLVNAVISGEFSTWGFFRSYFEEVSLRDAILDADFEITVFDPSI